MSEKKKKKKRKIRKVRKKKKSSNVFFSFVMCCTAHVRYEESQEQPATSIK